MRQIVVIGVDNQPCFLVPLVAAVWLWDRQGWECDVQLYGTPEHPDVRGAERALRAAVGYVSHPGFHLPALSHPESLMLARRLYARTLALNSDAFVILSDADILRLEPLVIPPDHGDRLVCWNRNYWDDTQWAPRWPSCHQGGTGKAWLPTMPIHQSDLDEARRLIGRCFVDDEILFKVMHAQRRFPLLEVDGSRRRLDRELWTAGNTLAGKGDAHTPRDMATDDGWARCLPLLADVLTGCQIEALDAFRREVNRQWTT